MITRSPTPLWLRLWRSIAWSELWMGMALAESLGLIALAVWYLYFSQ